MEKEVHGVIEKPVRTERGELLKQKNNCYVFRVRRDAAKSEIKRAVEEFFHVEVERVRTMVCPGKFRRVSRGTGYKPDWKKAIVGVKKGQTIELGDKK